MLFYKDKKVLVTGSSGFVGSWLSLALNELNAEVYGISLEPNTDPNLFNEANINSVINQRFININSLSDLKNVVMDISPDIVFHLAAQPLVRESYINPIETFNTNIIGTLNVLEACSFIEKDVNFITITTDKCYENNETGLRFIESDPMGGKDPYSASKACAEILTKSYALSFFDQNKLKIVTARGGNIIGGGDWSNDRIITDIVKSISKKNNITIRSPDSIRPWQHVIDVVIGYLKLGEYNQSKSNAFDSFNFGPSEANEIDVMTLTSKFLSYWNPSNSSIIIDDNHNPPESKILRLNSSKAKNILNWKPAMDIEKTIQETALWYKRFYSKKEIIEYSIKQLKKYI